MSSAVREAVCGLRKELYSTFCLTVLKAFIDDSGSGGDSPWVVLAGYVGTVDDWDGPAFGKEWTDALNNVPRINYFKASEAESLRSDGQWAGISKIQRDAKIDSLIKVIQRRARHAIYVRLKQRHYDRIVKNSLIKKQFENPYYILFTYLVMAIMALQNTIGGDLMTEFIFDSHERFEKPSKLVYEVLMEHPDLARLASPNILYRDDQKFLPLQAADLLAWQVRRRFCVAEAARPQMEAALRGYGNPPNHSLTLTEADLYDFVPKQFRR